MRSTITVVGFNFAIFIVGLAALELTFGEFFRENALNRLNLVRDQIVEYDLNGIYESNTGTAIYRRDRFGLRGEYESLDSIDLLTIGGSTVDQRFISEGLTFQDQMRALWAKRGRSLSVVNAGVDGQSTLGHIKNFKWWFPHLENFKPKHILFLIGLNDLFGNVGTYWDEIEKGENRLQTLPSEDAEVIRQQQAGGKVSELWRQYKEKSAIVQLYRTLRGITLAYQVKLSHGRGFQRADQHWTEDQKLTDHREVIEEDLKGYKERVRILIDKTKALGAIPIIATQGAHYYLKEGESLRGFNDTGFQFKDREVLGVDVYHFLRLYAEAAKEVCKQDSACIFVDLFNELELTTGDFYDNAHYTPKGAKKVAQYLVGKLDGLVTTEADRGQ